MYGPTCPRRRYAPIYEQAPHRRGASGSFLVSSSCPSRLSSGCSRSSGLGRRDCVATLSLADRGRHFFFMFSLPSRWAHRLGALSSRLGMWVEQCHRHGEAWQGDGGRRKPADAAQRRARKDARCPLAGRHDKSRDGLRRVEPQPRCLRASFCFSLFAVITISRSCCVGCSRHGSPPLLGSSSRAWRAGR